MRSLKWSLSKIPVIIAMQWCFFLSVANAGDWIGHESSLRGAAAKLAALEAELKILIQQKKHTTTPETLQQILEEIATKYQEMNKLSEDFHKEQLHMRFKHPEKGDRRERKYSRYRLKSLSEMESDVGLDGKLNRLKKKLQATFRSNFKKSEPEAGQSSRLPASAGYPERIILRK